MQPRLPARRLHCPVTRPPTPERPSGGACRGGCGPRRERLLGPGSLLPPETPLRPAGAPSKPVRCWRRSRPGRSRAARAQLLGGRGDGVRGARPRGHLNSGTAGSLMHCLAILLRLGSGRKQQRTGRGGPRGKAGGPGAGRGRARPARLRRWAALWRLLPAPSVLKPSKYLTGLVGQEENRPWGQVIDAKESSRRPDPPRKRGRERKTFECEGRPPRPPAAYGRFTTVSRSQACFPTA